MANKKFTVGSMFAGIGGICLGFKQAGASLVWANELDKHACITYRNNFGGEYLVEGDIQNIDTATIPYVDILTAGFPCQSFSSVGLLKGFEDPRGNLFFETARVIKAKEPQVVFLENVANLVKHDTGKTFNVIFSTLAELGYFVRYEVMNAVDYGIPQQRNRIYIVAFKSKNLEERFTYPKPRELQKTALEFFDKNLDNDYFSMEHHKKIEEMRAFMTDRSKVYRFTDWGISSGKSNICPTLLAAMGSPYERIPFFWDGDIIRKITPREAARLQGFPEDFIFTERTIRQTYKQIGNSVCVPIVREIAANVLKLLST